MGDPSPPAPQPDVHASEPALPRFDWSLALLGLCVFTFVIVTYYVRIAEVGIAIAALGLALQLGRLRLPFPVWLYGAFVLWAFAASFASPYPEIAREQVLEHLKQFAIMLIVVNALRTAGQLRFYLLFFLGCFVLFPLRGTLVSFASGNNVFGRALWNYIYNNPNDLAALSLLALGVALALAFALPPRSLARLGAGVSAILLLVVILMTQSRGAAIGLVAGMGPAFVVLGLKRPKFLALAVVLGVVVALALPAGVWQRLSGIEKLTRVSTIADADPEGSAAQRFEINKVAWKIFSDSPVFGVGLGAYQQANAVYAPELGMRDTHNTYLSLAAEVGLPGLLLWCALFGSVLRYAHRRRRLAAPGALAVQQVWIERALRGYLVTGLFATVMALTFPYLMLAVLWSSAALMASAPPGAASAAEENGRNRAAS
jgi:O-antigen ligase